MAFELAAIRREFPLLHDHRLVHLDAAGSTLRPRTVIERVARFELDENSALAQPSAEQGYAQARERIARHLGARAGEIVFCRGSTEAINLVAHSWGDATVGEGDEILVTELEHHANLAPWHALARRRGASVRTVLIDADGNLTVEACERLLGARTKLFAITHASNVLGAIPPLSDIVAAAHRVGACVLVDGAQAAAHLALDVVHCDADFYTFSGHKCYAPSGVGVLYGKHALLQAMPPWQLGANVIEDFHADTSRHAPPPARFEAGSANVAAALGLAAALDWLDGVGIDAVRAHETALCAQLLDGLRDMTHVRVLAAPAERVPIVSFCVDGLRAGDVRDALARDGVEVRAGHLSAQPLLRRLGVEDAVRVSLAAYNDVDDVQRLLAGIRRLRPR